MLPARPPSSRDNAKRSRSSTPASAIPPTSDSPPRPASSAASLLGERTALSVSASSSVGSPRVSELATRSYGGSGWCACASEAGAPHSHLSLGTRIDVGRVARQRARRDAELLDTSWTCGRFWLWRCAAASVRRTHPVVRRQLERRRRPARPLLRTVASDWAASPVCVGNRPRRPAPWELINPAFLAPICSGAAGRHGCWEV